MLVPECICVNKTSFQKRHEYVTVINDLDGNVLHVADGRGKGSLEGDAVDRARRAEHRRLAGEDDQRLKGSRYRWLTNPENMDEGVGSTISPSCAQAPCRPPVRGLQGTRDDAVGVPQPHVGAQEAWEAWYRSAVRCRLEPVRKVAWMIKRHLDGILTAVVDKVTNVRAESINAGIQKLKYSARGFRNRKRFRNAIYFHLGGLDLYPAGVTR